MPTFGKYNYAICRRMSKAAFIEFQNSLAANVGNGVNETNGVGKKNKKKDKKKNKELKKNGTSKTSQVACIDAIDGDTIDDEKKFLDYERVCEEMNNFIATLRMLNIDIIELCPDDDLRFEAVFAGDVAVTINGLVLLCRPQNRLNEIKEVMQIIKVELNLPIIEIKDEDAYLNGGDVLWTGREIFVGLSDETNEAGARAVAATFPEYPVTPVKVPAGENLRLKSFVTMAGPDIICVNRSQDSQLILRRMEREASYNYKLVTVDDNEASNVLYLNGTLLHRNDFPKSMELLQQKIDYPRVPVKISQVCKNHPSHGLDSLCILIRKSHRVQTIV